MPLKRDQPSQLGHLDKPLWTIMLYLSGDNNLSSAMIRAINDVGNTVFPKGSVAVTIQYDPVSSAFKPARYDLTRTRPKRPNLVPGRGRLPQDWARLRNFKVPENAATPKTLSDFIVWSIKEHSSTYRMLVLSGHGSGAVGDFLPDGRTRPAQRRRADPAKPEAGALTIPELGIALKNAETRLTHLHELKPGEDLLHVLGMDSCLMGMAEVAYRVRDFAQYLVASEGYVPDFGWPYKHLLDNFFQRFGEYANSPENLTPRAISGYIVQDYLSYYSDQSSANVSVDISSCDLTRLRVKQDSKKDLRSTLRHLTDLLCGYLDEKAPSFSGALNRTLVADLVVLAHWRAQSFKYEQYTDLWDFCMELKHACDRHGRFPEVARACQGVATSVEAVVGVDEKGKRQGFWGGEFQHAHGLAVYFPWSHPGQHALKAYGKIEPGRGDHHPGWARFLRFYLDTTRREPRAAKQPATSRPMVIGERNSASGSGNGVRTSPGYNRTSPGYNRLLPLLGGALPWSMKNPPTKWNAPRTVQYSTALTTMVVPQARSLPCPPTKRPK